MGLCFEFWRFPLWSAVSLNPEPGPRAAAAASCRTSPAHTGPDEQLLADHATKSAAPNSSERDFRPLFCVFVRVRGGPAGWLGGGDPDDLHRWKLKSGARACAPQHLD